MNTVDRITAGGKVGFFGFGRSSKGIYRYISSRMPHVSITVRSDGDIAASDIPRGARIMTGKDAMKDIREDVLFLSPSVRRDRPELMAATAAGIILSSDAELFFEESRLPCIAITGSDGKSSCTYLTASILRESGISATPCGNYGVSLCSLLGKDAMPIAELSSFQLNYMKPRTVRALITNITPNHLNWHKDMKEYSEAKLGIFENTDACVYDYDSHTLREALCKRKVFTCVSSERSYEELRLLAAAENYVTFKNGYILLNGKIYVNTAHAIRQEGYAIKNFMLSAAITLGLCESAAAERAIDKFRGLPHRAELIAEDFGVRYIDSSIDSTPERTLRTLGELSGDTAVILCGRGKRLSYGELASSLPKLTVGAIVMGDISEDVFSAMTKTDMSYKLMPASDMDEAIRLASRLLPKGGTVILSPSATSYDKYKDFKERGEDFRRAVTEYITYRRTQ